MSSFINYLVESGISLSLFAVVYFLFLRRETFFHVNRWFLLVAIGFSSILPMVHIPVLAAQPVILPEVTVTPYVNLLGAVTVYSAAISHSAEEFVLTYSALGYLYLAGVVFFAALFLLRISQIIRLIMHNQILADGNTRLVILEKEVTPFSFLNYIFVSKNLRNSEGWEKMIEHEKQHIHQGHTIDVLILEVLAVFQWFNPFFWMFRRALRENHEFLADQAVISHGTAPARYKQILLNQYVGEQIVIANNFNYSLIKTRIRMISKIKSKKITQIKFLVGVLLAACLVVVFACEQKDSEKTKLSNSGNSVTLVADGHTLQVTGDSIGIDKLKSILAESANYEMKPGNSNGELIIGSKTSKVDEVVVVSYNKQDQQSKPEEVFSIVEQMPDFPGGELALRKHIAWSVKYPVSAQEKGVQGKVFVNFVVGKDGSVGHAKIARGVDPALDAEALRVVNSLPKWNPGRNKGEVVAVSYTLPINFVLQ
ncbi:MAG: M56 family metallopeptidase [Prolixibacteraceae bacterium]|nr:M56 family metallopeptidase [Prolixibacteraceae bacterium]